MISVLDLAEQDTSLVRESYKSKMGPCPNYFKGKCSSRTDGFVVKLDADTGKWVYMCRGCWNPGDTLPTEEAAQLVSRFKHAGDKRGFGNDYNYLQHFRDMSPREIYAYREEQETGESSPAKPYVQPAYKHKNELPSWQEMAHEGILEYEAALWSSAGEAALEYLRTRGFTDDEMLKRAHVGYSEAGGIPRVLFPSINDGRVITIYRRDLRSDCPYGERWKDTQGGSKDELYRADCLKIKRPTILLESPPDALAIVQECGDEMCNTVATGGKDNARKIKALAKLALMPIVLVAFDAESDKGDVAAQWWLDRLPNARRLRPFLHDVNDMLTDGWDIRAWVGQAIQEYQQQVAQAENKYLEKVLELDPDTDKDGFLSMPEELQKAYCESLCDVTAACTICLEPATYEHEEMMYCEIHHPGRAALVQFADLVAQATQSEKKGPLQVRGIHHVRDWPQIQTQLIAEMREEYARQQRLQQERDRARLVAAHQKKMKRYSQKSMQQETLLDPAIVASIGATGGFMVDLPI